MLSNKYVLISYSLDTHPEAASALGQVRPKHLSILKKGALAGLTRGPRVGSPVINVQIVLHALTVVRGTADSFVMSAASQCVQKVSSLVIELI